MGSAYPCYGAATLVLLPLLLALGLPPTPDRKKQSETARDDPAEGKLLLDSAVFNEAPMETGFFTDR